MAAEISVFKQQNEVEGVILRTYAADTWDPATFCVRLSTRRGNEWLVLATGDAYTQFVNLEHNRAYKFIIPGKCVKNGDQSAKMGITRDVQIRFGFNMKITLCKEAWPVVVSYNCIAFSRLNQQVPGTFVDVIGRAVHVGNRNSDGSLVKRALQLRNQERMRACACTFSRIAFTFVYNIVDVVFSPILYFSKA